MPGAFYSGSSRTAFHAASAAETSPVGHPGPRPGRWFCWPRAWAPAIGDGQGVLHVRRRIYDGVLDELKTKGSNRKLPLPQALAERLAKLGHSDGDSPIFQSRNGSPLNPGNWLRREIRPAALGLGIELTAGTTSGTSSPGK